MKRTLILAILLTGWVAMAQGAGGGGGGGAAGGAAGGSTQPGMESGAAPVTEDGTRPMVEHPEMGGGYPPMGTSGRIPPMAGEDFSWMPDLALFSVPMHPGGSQPGFGNPMNPGASQPGQWALPSSSPSEPINPETAQWENYRRQVDLERIKKSDSRRHSDLMKIKLYCNQYAVAKSDVSRKSILKSMRPSLDRELKARQQENDVRIKDLEQQLVRAKETHRWRAEHWNDVVDQSAREITLKPKK